MKILIPIILALMCLSTTAGEPRVNPQEIDLGEVKRAVSVELFLHNDSEQPFVITGVEASCGCTQIKYSKQPISPKDSTKLTLRYTPVKNEVGVFYKTVKIYTSLAPKGISVVVRGTNKDQ